MKIKGLLFRFISSIFVTAVILTVAGSCVEELDGGIEDGQEQEYLAFSTRLSGEATKAAPMTMLSGEAGIIGYVYDTWPADTNAIKTFAPWNQLQNKSFTFDGDQLAATSGMVKWSAVINTGKPKLKVYAYSPASAAGMTVSYGTSGNHTLPSITYTSPTDISQQNDIVTAITEVGTGFKKNIPLTFDHILTGIRFKAGFDCTVKSITISNVASAGTYTMGEGWNVSNTVQNYTISFGEGKTISTGDMITDDADGNILFMIPQTFAANSSAAVTLTYGDNQTISTSLAGITWEEGRMITYTLHKTDDDDSSSYKTIYFDLAAGDVTINGDKYNGSIYTNNGAKSTFSGKHDSHNRYYIYQSTTLNEFPQFDKTNTGFASQEDRNNNNCRIPDYNPVMVGDTLWSDWITNNTNVEKVINTWCNDNHTAVKKVGRTGTPYYITVTGNLKCHITIDNLFSTAQHTYGNGTQAGIGFKPSGSNSELTINIVGDNRFGNLRYWNGTKVRADNGNKLILEGNGSLTVADVVNDMATNNGVTGHYGNHFNSAIGATDHGPKGSDGIVINGGIIFAGTTAAENSSAIGGGGNGVGVVTINGGTVTAVAHTTGTAIGGGIGFSSAGGPGYVTINGGNVYAYNLENPHGIPSAAIGGAGSSQSSGAIGHVTVNGGPKIRNYHPIHD